MEGSHNKASLSRGDNGKANGRARSQDKRGDNLAVVVLAAGNSSRLGRPKQAVRIAGECLLVRQLKLALSISANVTCVLGCNALAMKSLIPRDISEKIRFVNNLNWQSGMSSSIAASMKPILDRLALNKASPSNLSEDNSAHEGSALCSSAKYSSSGGLPVSGAILLLVDQWQLTEDNLGALLNSWQESMSVHDIANGSDIGNVNQTIHVAGSNDQFTPPAIFPRYYFQQLSELTGESGAKPLIKNNMDKCLFYDLPEAFFDLDTPEQLAAMQTVS